MSRILPHAAAISEFQGYSGDCGEDADLMAEHAAYDVPLDANSLNTLVRDEIKLGLAGASGAEPLSTIAKHWVTRKYAFDNYPYAQPFHVDWLGILKAKAGIEPIVMQFANAQALPGDEKGVHYHFATCLGMDDHGAFVFGDGDNTAARSNHLVTYTAQELANAQPCGLLVLHMPAQPAMPPTPVIIHVNEYFDEINGEWVVRPGHGASSGKKVRGGILNAYKTWAANGTRHGLTALGLPLEDEAAVPGKSNCWWQPFERGVLICDHGRLIDNPPGSVGDVYVGHTNYHP